MRSIFLAFAALLPPDDAIAQDRASDRGVSRYLDHANDRRSAGHATPPERPGAPKPVLLVQGGRIVDGNGAPRGRARS